MDVCSYIGDAADYVYSGWGDTFGDAMEVLTEGSCRAIGDIGVELPGLMVTALPL